MKSSVRTALLSIITILVTGMFAGAQTPTKPLINGQEKGGWRVFGNGVLDSALANDNEIQIAVSWKQASWGVGALYALDKPINAKTTDSIRVKIKTENGTQARVFAGVATKDDANLATKENDAVVVTGEWKNFTFKLSDMVKTKPDTNSQTFTESDWEKVEIVKLIFLKPTSATDDEDTIVFQIPELIAK